MLKYKSVFDLSLTKVQPRDMNFMDRTTLIGSIFFNHSFCTYKKYSLNIYFIFFCVSVSCHKRNQKFFTRAKRWMMKFDSINAILPMKFMPFGCAVVTLRSETILCINTP